MNLPQILSIIFSLAGATYIFIGIYALYLNPRNKTNILFFTMAIFLSIWSFGLGMSIVAENLSSALIWRRFAAIGFGAFFAIILHFFIIFTSHGASKCRKRFFILLYSPVLVVYLGFTYFPWINPDQYNMIKAPLGWVNIAANNMWDIFFIGYYITYFLTSLYIVWRWGRKNNSPKERKISLLIIISFTVTLVTASLTDILGNLIFDSNIPQIAPILMIFPAFVIYYSIRKYGMLNPKIIYKDAILMSDQIRTKVTNYISNTFLISAIINIAANYLLTDSRDLLFVFISSVFLALTGAFIRLIQAFVKSKTLKDIMVALVLSLIVPIITIRYFSSAAMTVWAFPYILLIVSIIFDNRFVQIILSVSIIFTQIAMWILRPEVRVTIDGANHMVRLVLFLMAITFARFASRIFQSKLGENAEQIAMQRITTEISTEFINVNEKNLTSKIDRSLSKLGSFLQSDRVYIYLFNEEEDTLISQGLWKNDIIIGDIEIDNKISASNYPKLFEKIEDGKIITLSDISDSLLFTYDELPKLLGSYDRSFLAMPIIIKNKVYGFIGIDSKSSSKKLPESRLGFIKVVSHILSATFERIQQEKEIIELAFYDHLTKLPNRFLFKDRVRQMISLSERTGNTLAVIFLDLDTFKSINDSIGHDGGDLLINKLAERLTKTLRKSDTVARFGGDKFLIMLTNLSSTKVIPIVIDKIIHIFDKPFLINEQEFFITFSAGISVYPYDGKDADSLIKNADLAMYKAKELGKNRYLFCTEDMREEVIYRMKLTNNLFRVLDRQELTLYYQPQVDTKSRKIVGVEALLRWFHPEFGSVSPNLFISLAEQTGLIGSIGDWVLREACRQCKEWHSLGLADIRVAVNVSPLQLKHPEFVQRLIGILKDTGLDAKHLEIELTEGPAVSNTDFIIDVLSTLKDQGITISIDDFGTEYSSLSRLSSMPIDRIKLDMHFTHRIDESKKQNAIIKSIIELSHTLGLKVVAEGVETEPQLNFLSENKSDIIQGHYFYRPLPPDEIKTILSEQVIDTAAATRVNI